MTSACLLLHIQCVRAFDIEEVYCSSICKSGTFIQYAISSVSLSICTFIKWQISKIRLQEEFPRYSEQVRTNSADAMIFFLRERENVCLSCLQQSFFRVDQVEGFYLLPCLSPYQPTRPVYVAFLIALDSSSSRA